MTNFKSVKHQIGQLYFSLQGILKWSALVAIIGVTIGSASALFLTSLETVTNLREHYPQFLFFLPLAGLATGLLYYYCGKDANKGVKLLIEEFHLPRKKVPFKMAPMVLLGTLLTHLFGGSAGREGTALQIGAAIADQFNIKKYATILDRKTLILIGVSAGFGSVFGTPFAGILFAFELLSPTKITFKKIITLLVATLIANETTIVLGITHPIYIDTYTNSLNINDLLKVGVIGIISGLLAVIFIQTTKHISIVSNKLPVAKYTIPFLGAIVFVSLILLTDGQQYMGLGIETITKSFYEVQQPSIFIWKIILTALTLGVGFKGGEVTPLFFIGATFGSFASSFLGLEIELATAIGFIAVFAGATKAPIASVVMGIELFGFTLAPYLIISCMLAYFCSGKHTIYN